MKINIKPWILFAPFANHAMNFEWIDQMQIIIRISISAAIVLNASF